MFMVNSFLETLADWKEVSGFKNKNVVSIKGVHWFNLYEVFKKYKMFVKIKCFGCKLNSVALLIVIPFQWCPL